MTKQQEQTELNELIKTSRIYKAIEILEKTLKDYQQLELIQENRYTIQLKFSDVNKEITELKSQIENLIRLSHIWELNGL